VVVHRNDSDSHSMGKKGMQVLGTRIECDRLMKSLICMKIYIRDEHYWPHFRQLWSVGCFTGNIITALLVSDAGFLTSIVDRLTA